MRTHHICLFCVGWKLDLLIELLVGILFPYFTLRSSFDAECKSIWAHKNLKVDREIGSLSKLKCLANCIHSDSSNLSFAICRADHNLLLAITVFLWLVYDYEETVRFFYCNDSAPKLIIDTIRKAIGKLRKTVIQMLRVKSLINSVRFVYKFKMFLQL